VCKVCVDLCAAQKCVAKELADVVELHPALHQVCGDAVTQGMQPDYLLLYRFIPRPLLQLLQRFQKYIVADALALMANEKSIFTSAFQ
jgi:hypothetical protein